MEGAAKPTPTQKRANFLEDESGSPSAIRPMSLIAIVAAISLSLILLGPLVRPAGLSTINIPVDLHNNGTLAVLSLLLTAFGLKVRQKFRE